MVIRIGYARVLGGVAAMVAGVSGCAGTQVCAGVGVVSEVGVYVVQDGYDGLAGASYELCTRGECVKGEFRQEGVSHVSLRLPDDVDPDTAPVRLRVTRDDATTPVIDDSVDVKLLHQSDGCGGGAYHRALAFAKEDGLMPEVPKNISAAWLQQVRSGATAAADPSVSP
ncbi:hypothetical protein [Streptomyces bicolor]|uniref:hypothetical protein n=1 Tax=Streptomyces bicolor TaxID=66874 RepID=UPI0004E149E6|nr:hypothetical protein [Streptomyces bicolor]